MRAPHKIYAPAWLLAGVFLSLLMPGIASAQDESNTNARLQAIETYVQGIEPAMNQFSTAIQSQLVNYAKELEDNLNRFAAVMQDNLKIGRAHV